MSDSGGSSDRTEMVSEPLRWKRSALSMISLATGAPACDRTPGSRANRLDEATGAAGLYVRHKMQTCMVDVMCARYVCGPIAT